MMTPDRRAFYEQFVLEYETVRRKEGRGDDEPEYYQFLPFIDITGRRDDEWCIRALSFQFMMEEVVMPAESERPMAIIDLGAGNGWMSHRLAMRGHNAAAVDLTVNAFDGLGAHVHYDYRFLPVQAEFDRLPFLAGRADLAVFNASLHYSPDMEKTLTEALRVVGDDGEVIVVDTPVYHDRGSGEMMVAERQAAFRERFGFPSDALPSENFLTCDRLDALGMALGCRVDLAWPIPRWRRRIRRWRARRGGRREAGQFPLVRLHR